MSKGKLTVSWISTDAPASSRTLQDWRLPFSTAWWNGVLPDWIETNKQTLKDDFASEDLNLLHFHADENGINISELQSFLLAENFTYLYATLKKKKRKERWWTTSCLRKLFAKVDGRFQESCSKNQNVNLIGHGLVNRQWNRICQFKWDQTWSPSGAVAFESGKIRASAIIRAKWATTSDNVYPILLLINSLH